MLWITLILSWYEFMMDLRACKLLRYLRHASHTHTNAICIFLCACGNKDILKFGEWLEWSSPTSVSGERSLRNHQSPSAQVTLIYGYPFDCAKTQNVSNYTILIGERRAGKQETRSLSACRSHAFRIQSSRLRRQVRVESRRRREERYFINMETRQIEGINGDYFVMQAQSIRRGREATFRGCDRRSA